MKLFTCVALAASASAQGDAPEAPPVPAWVRAVRTAARALEANDLQAAQRALDATVLEERAFEWEHLRLGVELARAASVGPGMRASGRMPRDVAADKVGPVSTLRGHASAGLCVAISPTGDRIASGGRENEVRIWNARTGDVERLLVGHTGPVAGLAFAPNGARLASASEDGTTRVWELADGRCALTLKGGEGALTAIAWSPDGARIATADASLAVRVWDAFQSQPRFALRGHGEPILALAFSADGRQVASGSADGTVRIADVTRGEVERTLAGDRAPVTACRFDPGRNWFTAGRRDGTIARFDLASGTLSTTLRPEAGSIGALAFTPDGRRFVIGTDTGALKVFEAALGLQVLDLQASGEPIRSLAFDARGSRLVACGDDHAVRVFETEAARARALQRASTDALPSLEAAVDMKPLEIEAQCRRVVHHAGLDPLLYEQAGELARAARDRLPESGQIGTTLGAAQYRLAKHEDALVTLKEAGEVKRGWPPNLAFRAMALAKLGQLAEAQTWMQRLDTLLLEERWKGDAESHALADEARAVLAAARSAKR